MKYKYITLIVSIIFISILKLSGQDIKVYDDFIDFENEILTTKKNQKKVINFFAMYCKPCLEELPYFIESASMNKSIDYIWVSLDFDNDKLSAFIKEKKIGDRVVWLKAAKQNDWIPKVHKDWDGPIPITLFIDHMNKQLSTEVFESVDELNKAISTNFNLN